jgi:hypothetical protein
MVVIILAAMPVLLFYAAVLYEETKTNIPKQ